MANKITQLVNESGDNLYPLAGGMAADSIDTQMLKDGAVTSDKIDWTTLPVDSISATLTVGGNSSTVSLPKIKIAEDTFLITGIVSGVASSVTAGSRTNVRLSLSDANVTACLGGAVSVYQNAMAGSYTQYARISPANGSVDAYCMCADSTNTRIWLNYLAIIKIG